MSTTRAPMPGSFALLREDHRAPEAGYGCCVLVDRTALCVGLAGRVLVFERRGLESGLMLLGGGGSDCLIMPAYSPATGDELELVRVALRRRDGTLATLAVGAERYHLRLDELQTAITDAAREPADG